MSEQQPKPRTRRRSHRSNKKKEGDGRAKNSTLVVGQFESIGEFQELLEKVKTECGDYRKMFYRANQNCGFIYFFDEETTTKAQTLLHGSEFEGRILRAFPPQLFFPDEADARPQPQNPKPKPEPVVVATQQQQAPPMTVEEKDTLNNHQLYKKFSTSAASLTPDAAVIPTAMLVLKNINFTLRQDKLLEVMKEVGCAPDCVNYLYDPSGKFRGTAFAHYPNIELSQLAYEKLNGIQIANRDLRVEYKRRHDSAPAIQEIEGRRHSTRSRVSIQPAVTTIPTPGGSFAHTHSFMSTRGSVVGLNAHSAEVFNPATMDSEQEAIMKELERFLANKYASEWNFPTTMTQAQRNMIREIASYLGLYHVSIGDVDARYVVVSKKPFSTHSSLGRDRFMSVGEASSHLHSRMPARVHPRANRAPMGPDGTRGFHNAAAGRGRGKFRVYHSLITGHEPTRSGSVPVVRGEGIHARSGSVPLVSQHE